MIAVAAVGGAKHANIALPLGAVSRHGYLLVIRRALQVAVFSLSYWSCLASVTSPVDGSAIAQTQGEVKLPDGQSLPLEPACRKAQDSLQQQTRFYWSNQPLRSGLQKISDSFVISIWLDRRIDPSQPITLGPPAETAREPARSAASPQASRSSPAASTTASSSTAQLTTEGALLRRLQLIADQVKAEAGLVGNVLLIAPAGELAKIQRSAVRLHAEIATHDRKLATRTQPWRWQELATPADIQDDIQRQWNIEIDGQLPHDLLHAGELPQPIHLAAQLAILCGGFDRQASTPDGRQFELKPLDSRIDWQASYPVESLSQRQVEDLNQTFRTARFSRQGSRMKVQGPTNLHLSLLGTVQPAAADGNRPRGRSVWSFEIENQPFAAVMVSLSRSIDFALEWSPKTTDAQRSQLLTLKVSEASLDELLQKVCEAADFEFRREGQRVWLEPSAPP